MHDVIQALLQTEAEAKRLVQAARLEAEQVTRQAQEQAAALVARALAEARVEGEKLVCGAVEQATAAKRQQIEQSQRDIQIRIQLPPERVTALGRAVVEAVSNAAGRQREQNLAAGEGRSDARDPPNLTP
jgi:vacuolar-type H+-ATPase subunit H